MTRRALVAVLGGSAALLLVVVVGCVGAAIRAVGNDPGDTSECRESVRAEEAKVRTKRWDPPEELPGLGDYLEIHWQVRSLSGEPCGRAPGPVDWAYQGVVRLRPADARTLAQRYDFVPYAPAEPDQAPLTSPADAWPALAPFLPAAPRWLHSRAYDEATPATRWRTAFLDVEHRTLFFTLQDH
ncbi:hypothetical protein RM555_30700 [Micromonospora sp. DSM 115977]|uniref:Uncharacterized protein n=1 Tax=Micromonospora reichwaldensis TaxID=3075516 RepID=A0ABU2X5B4_9ACTN|nr:hypothetical protein [Micromonospora sp. DSM 115977]MDT0533365.1 hypothetical protein [Micromonospora sp. DSM 115977]